MNDSLGEHTCIIQGVTVNITCDDALSSLLSDYFHMFSPSQDILERTTLNYSLNIVDDLPSIPRNITSSIETPYVTYFRNDEKVYTQLRDGSFIVFDSIMHRAEGFLKKTTLKNPALVYALVGSSILEGLTYYGKYLIHAAALQGDGVGILVSGDGGCGKTTTTLGLVREGFQYVSDDSLFLRDDSGVISVSPLYNQINVDQDLADRFPELAMNMPVTIEEGTKEPFDLDRLYPGSFINSLKPDVLFFPEIVSGRKSTLEPVSQIDAFTLLLNQTILSLDISAGREHLKVIEKLVKQTRAFRLWSGTDIFENPKKLVELINETVVNCGYC